MDARLTIIKGHIMIKSFKVSFRTFLELFIPVIGLLIALIIAGVIIIISGNNPFEVYGVIFKGAFGSVYGITSVFRWMTPLLFLSVAASFALKAGLWNLGLEGQLYLGAIFGTWIGFSLGGPPGVVVKILAMLLAAGMGALWALIPALLRAYFKTNEFIVTLLLNFVAIHLTHFLTLNVWQDRSTGGEALSTPPIFESAQLSKILPGYTWHMGFLIGIIFVVLYWAIMKWTTFGYELKVHGHNPNFLKYGGVSVKKIIILSMCLSGAVAGMTGTIEIFGIYRSFWTGMFAGGVAWDGLVVALLGLFKPFGILIAAFFFGFLKVGILNMERVTEISRSVVTIIQAIIIFFIAVQGLAIRKRIIEKRED